MVMLWMEIKNSGMIKCLGMEKKPVILGLCFAVCPAGI